MDTSRVAHFPITFLLSVEAKALPRVCLKPGSTFLPQNEPQAFLPRRRFQPRLDVRSRDKCELFLLFVPHVKMQTCTRGD